MTAEGCIEKIKAILEADSTLKTYNRKVFEGVRSNIPKTQMPCIILEPGDKTESEAVFPCERVTFSLVISGYIIDYDADHQLRGTSSKKGIMDLERDIMKALATDKTLTSNCLKFSFPTVNYDITNYPIRGVNITMSILYEQNFDTRT